MVLKHNTAQPVLSRDQRRLLVVGEEKGRIAQPGSDDALVSRYNLFWLLALDIGDSDESGQQ